MGSCQKAVNSFLDLISADDGSMLDRWIPDEDWVRQMRLNYENDCTILQLNSGLTRHCIWQNNHAILEGKTIFFNKKKIQISQTKATKKNIRFYYVLSHGNKSIPTVPSDQGFYQSLWDEPDRSNRSLKRQAKKSGTLSSPPEAKKSKTSDVSTDEPSTVIIPKLFEEAACKNPAYQAGCEGERRTCRG